MVIIPGRPRALPVLHRAGRAVRGGRPSRDRLRLLRADRRPRPARRRVRLHAPPRAGEAGPGARGPLRRHRRAAPANRRRAGGHRRASASADRSRSSPGRIPISTSPGWSGSTASSIPRASTAEESLAQARRHQRPVLGLFGGADKAIPRSRSRSSSRRSRPPGSSTRSTSTPAPRTPSSTGSRTSSRRSPRTPGGGSSGSWLHQSASQA